MGKFYNFFKNNKVILFPIVSFVIAACIILLFFPSKRKFEFEYQQNKVWQHRDLFAPFSFSIDKTDEEIRNQRDSIMEEFAPYYVFDTSVYSKVLDSITYKLNALSKNSNLVEPSILNSNILQKLYAELQQIYNKGIIDVQKPYKTIILDKKPIKTKVLSKDVYTLQKAHQKLSAIIQDNIDSVAKNKYLEIIYNSIIPNVRYNESISGIRKSEILSKVSEKYGFISEGSRIISKGNIVTANDIKILDSLKREYETTNLSFKNFFFIVIGQFLLLLILFLVLILLLYYFEKEVLFTRRYIAFIVSTIVLFVALASISLTFNHLSIYIVPYIALPIVIKNFINARVAIFVHIITMLIIGFFAPNGFDFILIQLTVGFLAVISVGNHYQRSSLFMASIFSFIAYALIFIGLSMIKLGGIEGISWLKLLWFGVSCILVFTSYVLIVIFERLFRIPSDLTLFELSDTNRGLLRELNENAPGTFQHSLQVANLTEVALRKIGGNALLGRVAGLYHDIGKLSNPAYFIENQSFMGNPHDSIPPEQSARIIINHVFYGRELARKNKLPLSVTRMIFGHHASLKTKFFLEKYRKLNPDIPVDESLFRYPEQRITQKEMAVLMIADSVEAASRSLQINSKEQIQELVERIINGFIIEKQFEFVDITLNEINKVKEVVIEKLINMSHARVPYPQERQQN